MCHTGSSSSQQSEVLYAVMLSRAPRYPSYSVRVGVAHVAPRWEHLAGIIGECGICIVVCVRVAAVYVGVVEKGDPGWGVVALDAYD